MLKYSAVSAVSVAVTQSVLFAAHSGLGLAAWLANVIAVCLAAWPAYVLNRRWVWVKRDTHSLTREIVPFWAYNLVGLALSTAAVALVAGTFDDSSLAVQAANIAAFGALWVGKYLLLDRVLFGAGQEQMDAL